EVSDQQRDTLLLRPKPDEDIGLRKEIDITLAPVGSQVTVVHRITNIAREPATLAIWSLSVIAHGGVEIIPLPRKSSHPGHPRNARSPADFAHSQTLSIWPFFDFADPRWRFGSRFITLKQDSTASGPTKLGLSHRVGWV